MTNDQWQMTNSRGQSDPVYLSLVICHFEEIATPLPGRIRLLQYSRGERSVTFCCRPPGPLARRERRAIPGAVCEERATKPASLLAAAHRGAGSSCNPCRGAYRCSFSTRGFASPTPQANFLSPPLGPNTLPYL